MKTIGIFFTAIFLILIALPLWAQPHPHPYEVPAINFQGRIEEGDIGYSGPSTFRFWIGNEDMTSTYWGPKDAQVTCVEGIYNVIIGRDTDPLTADLFTGEDSYYLQVAFSTDGSYFETLEPTQEILTVPFAVNAHLLDGLGAPQSAFVGLTDVQTIEGKTMLDTILTRPVIDSSYFILSPGTVPDDPALGYLAFDDDGDVLKYWDGTAWVPVGVSPEDSPWYRDGTTIRPRTTGDFVQLTGTSRFWFSRTAQGSAASPLISFNPEDGGTGIYSTGDHQIDFSTQSARRFSIRRHGFALFEPITHLESGEGAQGGLYFNQQTNTFMYHDGTRWQPIATGEGSIPKPDGQYYTLFATDGTTWESNRELRVYPGSRVSTWNDLQVGSVASVQPKLFFGGATGTNFTYFTGGTLVLSNAASPTLTFTHNNRVRLAETGTRAIPALSFGDQTDLGIYVDDEDKHISFVSDQTDMFSIRGEGHVRFRPIGHPAPANARPGDLYFNNQTGSFMYYWAGAWRPIASGEGSIPKPDNEYDTLYAVDGDTWAPTDELHIRPGDEYVRTKHNFRVGHGTLTGQMLTFGGATGTGFLYPGGSALEFWTNQTRQITLTSSGHMQMRHGGSVGTPVISLGNETDTGIYHLGVTNSIGFTIGGERLFALRPGLYTVHEPLTEDPATSHAGGLYFNQQSGTFMYAKVDSGDWYPIATGEGSIPSPNAQHDILYASDSDTWTPTNELRVYPDDRVSTYNDLQVGRAGYMDAKINFRGATTSYISSPAAGIFEFYSGGSRRLRISGSLTSTTDPGVTFFTDSSGIFRPASNQLGIAVNAVEALRINHNQLVGINTLAAPEARLHVKETSSQPALWVTQTASDQYAVRIEQGAERSALRINQAASTGDSEPGSAVADGGALHVWAGTGAFGSAITAFSNQSAAAPMVWFRGGSSFNRQPILRLQAAGGTAAPLHLVPMSSKPAPAGTWNTYTGALYVHVDGTLYYNNGTDWLALPGEAGEEGPIFGSGTDKQVAYWVSETELASKAAFAFDYDTDTMTVSNIGAFTLAGTLTGGAQTISGTAFQIGGGTIDSTTIGQTTAALGRFSHLTAVDSLTSANLAADRVIYTGAGGLLSVDNDLQFDGSVLTVTAGDFTTLTSSTLQLGSGTRINEFSIDGTLGDDSDDAVPTEKAVKTYVDGLMGERVGGSGTDGQVAYWTSDTEIGGEAGFTYDDDTDTLTAANITASGLNPGRIVYTGTGGLLSEKSSLAFAAATDELTLESTTETGRALEIKADDLTTGRALYVSSASAAHTRPLAEFVMQQGATGDAGAMFKIARHDEGRALNVITHNLNQSGSWFNSTTVTGGQTVTIKANSPDLTGQALFVHQDHSDAAGRAQFIRQDGPGEGLRVTISEDGPAVGKSAIWVNTNRSTEPSLSSQTGGGAIHVDNRGNIGPAITAWSSQTAPEAALVWLRVAAPFTGQPVLRLDGRTGEASPLRITPQTAAAASAQTGDVYVNTNGTIQFYNGTDWIALTGDSGGLAGTGAHGQVTFWDTADSITGDSNFYWDTDNNRLGIGISTPARKIHVRDTAAPYLLLENYDTGQNNLAGLIFKASGQTVAHERQKAAIFYENTIDWGRGNMYFALNDDGDATNVDSGDARMTLTYQGRVGIGTTAPDTQLHTTGTVRFEGAGSPGAGKVLTSSDADGTAIWTVLTGADGDITGSGAEDRVTFWTGEKTVGSDENFTFADSRLSAPHATFTGLTASHIDAFTLAGTLTGGAQTISGTDFQIGGGTIDSTTIGQTTAAAGAFTNLTASTLFLSSGTTVADSILDEDNMASDSDTALATQQSIKAYVDGLTDDRVGGTGTAEQVAFWTSDTEIGGDADLTFDGTVLSGTSGDFTTLTAGIVALDEIGSAGAPVITWANDPDTGLFRPSANVLAFATGGAEKLRIHSLTGGTEGAPLLQLSGDSTSGIFRPAENNIAFSTAGTEALRIRLNQQVGIGTGSSTSARLHIDQTASADAFRIDQRTDNYAAYIRQTGAESALWIEQRASTGADEPSNTQGGALHVWNVGDAFGSGISAFSNIGADAVAPLVWFRGGSSFDRQPVLRLQGHTGKAAPLHLVPMAKPAPGGTWDSYTGAFYVALDGTLYFNDGTDWQALPGEAGDVSGSGSPDRVTFWTDTDTVSSDADFTFADSRLSAPHATFTGLTASHIDAFTLAGTLTGGAQTISGTDFQIGGGTIDSTTIGQTTAAAGQFTVLTATSSIADTNLTAGSVIFAGTGGVLSQDNANFFWDNTNNRLGIGTTGPSQALDIDGQIRVRGGSPGANKVLTSTDATGLATWEDPAGDVSGTGADGRVAFWTGEKELGSNASFTFDGTVLGATGGSFTHLTGVTSLTAGNLADGRVTYAGPGGVLTDDESFTFDGTVLSAPTGTFSTLTSSLDAGQIVYTGPGGLLTVDSALAFDDTGETVTLDSGVTDGTAMEIKADDLTTGSALAVSSTAADTKYDLATFTAATGRALVISHTGGSGGAGNEAVLIERATSGRALSVHADNLTHDAVYLRSTTLTSGNLLTVTSQSDDLSTGAAVNIVQTRSAAAGNALAVAQSGRGKAALFTNATGFGVEIRQDGSSRSTIDGDGGGAFHIRNTGNIFGALTVYSNQGADQSDALATLKTGNTAFDHPLLSLYPPLTGNAPHLYLRPIDQPTPESLVEGLLYADRTTNALMYYNGTAWVALTGSAGGAGDFALVDLSNIDPIAADLIPDANNTRDLGSGAASWKDLHIDGTATLADVDIGGGEIDGTTIGLTTPAAAEFSTLTADSVALDTTGSAASPAITWEADPNTGFYRLEADTIGISTGGILRATFSNAGHLRLSASGTNNTPIVAIGGETNTGMYQASSENIDFTNVGTRQFSMRSSGVFRIIGAAAAPAAAAANAGGLFWDSDDKSMMYSDGARWITLTGASELSGSGAAGQATFWSSANEVDGDNNFFWDNTNKRLGLGTDEPALRLDARGTNADSTNASEDILRIASTSAAPLQLRLGLKTGTAASRYGYIDVEDDGNIRHLVLQKDGGNVGIGTTDPRSLVQISSSLDGLPLTLENPSSDVGNITGVYFKVHGTAADRRKGAIIFESTDTWGRGDIHFATNNTAGADDVSLDDSRMTVTADGKVGIGTTDPDEALSVAGRAWLQQTEAPGTTTDRLYNVKGSLHWDGDPLGRWTFQEFTRASDSTFTVTDNAANQAIFRVGIPIRYADTLGTWRYGMVVSYAGGTVTLSGAPMTTDFDTYLQTGAPEMLRQANFYKPGDLEAGDNFMGLATWQMSEGYVVRATGQLETAADGADALVAIGIGAAGTDLITAPGQLDLGQATDQVATNTDIDTDNYDIAFGEQIFINVDQVGSSDPGAGLLVTLQVITP